MLKIFVDYVYWTDSFAESVPDDFHSRPYCVKKRADYNNYHEYLNLFFFRVCIFNLLIRFLHNVKHRFPSASIYKYSLKFRVRNIQSHVLYLIIKKYLDSPAVLMITVLR